MRKPSERVAERTEEIYKDDYEEAAGEHWVKQSVGRSSASSRAIIEVLDEMSKGREIAIKRTVEHRQKIAVHEDSLRNLDHRLSNAEQLLNKFFKENHVRDFTISTDPETAKRVKKELKKLQCDCDVFKGEGCNICSTLPRLEEVAIVLSQKELRAIQDTVDQWCNDWRPSWTVKIGEDDWNLREMLRFSEKLKEAGE